MITFSAAIHDFWSTFINVIKSFNFPSDVLDVAIIAFIIYHAIRLIRETRAMQLLKGVLAILVVYFLSYILNLITLSFFIRNLISIGVIAVIVLFQPEMRSALEKMGRTKWMLSWTGGGQTVDEQKRKQIETMIDVLVESCMYLSSQLTGALIVIERNTKLGEIIHTGTTVDAEPSQELIGNLFFKNSPLHDGAVVIRDCRIYAAGCYLPLSQNMEIGRELGTRHRAALGISEVSDAVIIVVSEETGAITLASESRLQRHLSEKNLQKLLQVKLLGQNTQEIPQQKKTGLWKGRK